MKVELCNFSGYKIHPGHGKIYVRTDNRSYRFINGKSESYFLQKLKPSKLDWTVVFRRLHKKGITEETTKKRVKRTVKYQRDIVGASLEAIRAKRNMKPEVREAERKKAVQEAKDKKRKEQEEKKKTAAPTKGAKSAQPKISKMQAKGAPAKVSAKSR
ncbi:hypothetical protein M427DRAFT_111771 [Gonapodya prolifera JEL478]|uniref:Large ribosomal subunit protein eL24-related N-terminal domain-containing protein n=1 Tax=Gonapodya prolifera (strain JEL478) TaxID=1344416 RepID=A0A139AG35_GONPJ|nr:hypothetical protein M427DRAFT_111771 [Gonapodya prolifera JEL478]|eukprot:KXS15718.1 hypothetical protein M427DRAFT_111771 [Gonapodya prolifera JEL478]